MRFHGARVLWPAAYEPGAQLTQPVSYTHLLLSETSRNLALAVRLFGNIMSGSMIVGILLAIAPFFFPVLMQALGLLTGMIQAYIFAILAMVYIAAAVQRGQEER